jgi:hypothetical protein
MKYSISNTINTSLDKVAEELSNPDGVKYWTENLLKVEQTNGDFCDIGSTRNLYYKFRDNEMVVSETILEQNLPGQIKFVYDSKIGRNIVELVFEELSENRVKQTSNTTLEFKGAMNFIGYCFKSILKKQSEKYLQAFKRHMED